MEVARSSFKANDAINNVVRNTSCSSGWLRVVVQSIFGVITVTSFVLILLMAVARPPSTDRSSCSVANCMVNCGPATFNDGFERDVVNAVLDTGLGCTHLILRLVEIDFEDGAMPASLFSRLSSNVERLAIIGGNLQHIPSNAFLGQFGGAIRTLTFDEITITSWTTDMFVGLRTLEELTIKDSVIKGIGRHALRAVDDTIKKISLTGNGKWDPRLLTGNKGLDSLKYVDFSLNHFGSVIHKRTFTGLQSCKVLFLNSCKITSIGAGAFDSLESIDMLYLNDNHIVSIPPGLFATILSIEEPKPRVHLQDNLWKCDCSQIDLMLLSKNDMLMVDPVCFEPDYLHGEPFSSLEKYCTESNHDVEIIFNRNTGKPLTDGFNTPCYSSGGYSAVNSSLRVISPVARFQCQLENRGRFQRMVQHWHKLNKMDIDGDERSWLKPTFLFRRKHLSIMEVDSVGHDSYGLVWFNSICPNEVHCISVMPSMLRVYNFLLDTTYTFCPIDLSSTEVEVNDCVFYNTSYLNNNLVTYIYWRKAPIFYFITGILCLLFGAAFVYGVIRKNPTLLKGSKRILIVKHRDVDALVLPPKVPLRSSLMGEEEINGKKEGIFSVYDDGKMYANHFHRSNSVRSDRSSTPTYISAMQPTEVQLAEWRLRNHFDTNDSIISINSDVSRLYWMCDGSEDNSTKIPYESFK